MILLVLFLVLLSIVTAEIDSFQIDGREIPILRTPDKKPMIHVSFEEPSKIVGVSLYKPETTDLIPVAIFADDFNQTFRFTPENVLDIGFYGLEINATDMLGNAPATGQPAYAVLLEILPLDIELINPRHGIAISDPFDINISTDIEANCRWSAAVDSSYTSFISTEFSVTGSTLHTQKDITNIIPGYIFHVFCNDTFGIVSNKDFPISMNTAKPIITAAYADPNPILGEPGYTLLKVTTDVPTLCKYSSLTQVYEDMEGQFLPWDQANTTTFSINHIVNRSKTEDKKSYNYFVVCENLGSTKSKKSDISFSVDLDAPLTIDVHTPRYFYNNNNIYLNLSTNRKAFCVYNDEKNMFNEGIAYTYTHLKRLNIVNIGTYSYDVKCSSPGKDNSIFENTAHIDITYDNSLPQMISIDDNNITCPDSDGDYRFSAEFEAEDNESGIKEYIYHVREGKTYSSRLIVNYTRTTKDRINIDEDYKGDDLNLTVNKKYYFFVKAVNNVGQESKEMISDGIEAKILTQDICKEKNPPRITTIIRNVNEGANITLICKDVEGKEGKPPSGCNKNEFYYGSALTKSSCFSKDKKYDGTFLIDRNSWICYTIGDFAENVFKGSRYINLSKLSGDSDSDSIPDFRDNCPSISNPLQEDSDDDGIGDICEPASREGCILDADMDGYGLGCNNGPDCDDTNIFIHTGCASGCTQDSDGDSYGMDCIKGPDCDDTNPSKHNTCTNGCIQDNDGDGYGMGCTSGLDCNDADADIHKECTNGCLQDSDGDGYGIGCSNGLDCNDNAYLFNGRCPVSKCDQDNDGDGYGVGCDNGPDCNDMNPTIFVDCLSGCVQDSDGDGYGLDCTLGFDCNDQNQELFDNCNNGCLQDGDGDGYGYNCSSGWDCDDTNYLKWDDCVNKCIQDTDGDQRGLGCDIGSDCNDYTNKKKIGCLSGCTYDSDCDGMDDDWETKYGLDPNSDDTLSDSDADGYNNIQEYRMGREPNFNEEKNDRDNDGMNDDWEIEYGLNPNKNDSALDLDSDGLTNLQEFELSEKNSNKWQGSLDPKNKDTDGDGYSDSREVSSGTDPTNSSSHPEPVLAFIFFVLGLLFILGGVGYIGYKKYVESMRPKFKPSQKVGIESSIMKPDVSKKPIMFEQKPESDAHRRFMERMHAKEQGFKKVFGNFKSEKLPLKFKKGVEKSKSKLGKSAIKTAAEIKPTRGKKASDLYREIIKEETKKKSVFDRLKNIVSPQGDFKEIEEMGGSLARLRELNKKESTFDKLNKLSSKSAKIKIEYKKKDLEKLNKIKTGRTPFQELARIRKEKVDAITKLRMRRKK